MGRTEDEAAAAQAALDQQQAQIDADIEQKKQEELARQRQAEQDALDQIANAQITN